MEHPIFSKKENEIAGSADEPRIIKVIEEFATIDSEIVETGRIKITKTVTNEETAILVPIVNESYQIKHVKVNPKVYDEPPTALVQNGDTTIIKVLREISVIVKKYELVEEIHITRQLSQTPLTHEITLRKEQVHIERSNTSS